jgi:hypothetical protein
MATLAAAAREAFAAGWALSGGPMTDRVRAGALAAVHLACEHADDPHILEVTLKLGQLEGVWATVYERREQLIADHTKTVTKIWRSLIHGLDARRLITRYRADQFMPTEAADPLLNIRRGEAKTAALGYLNGVHYADGYDQLRDAVADALRSARAEGWTSGKHIHAEHTPKETVADPWAVDFTHYYDQLRLLDDWPALADRWIQTLIDGAGTDLGNMLATMSRDGASYEDMLSGAEDLLGSGDVRAVSTLLDYAMSDAITQGSVNLYASEGVRQYDVLTAGDSRVCTRCQDAEAENPYPVGQSPPIPSHPMCVVGSTRVTVPSDLVGVMSGDEPNRLALDPAHAAVGFGGEVGAASTTTMTEAGFDFGRRNIRAVTVREFVGEVVTIRIASGEELTATPNHPIATPGGWVPIAELAMGDHVLRSTRSEREVLPVDPDVDDIPPCIEDVAKTFPVAFGPMPTAAEDFHGDGAGSEIHVVRTDRFLMDDLPASVTEHVREQKFGGGDVAVGSPLVCDGDLAPHLERALLAPDGIVRGAGDPGPLLWTGLRHPQVHRVASAARFNTGLEEPATDGPTAHAEGFRDGLLAFPGEIAANDLRVVDNERSRIGVTADTNVHASVSENPPDWFVADTEGFCEGLHALAADIAADEVVDVRRHPFSGHVYNLETVGGWYIGNSIVTHNCRCAVAPNLSQSTYTQYLPEGAPE